MSQYYQISAQELNTLREALKIVELIDTVSKGGSTAAPKIKKETKSQRDARILQQLKNKLTTK